MKAILTTLSILLSLTLFAQEPAQPDSTQKPATKPQVSAKEGKTAKEAKSAKEPVTTYEANPDSIYGDTTKIELNNAYITIVSKVKEEDEEDEKDHDNKYQLTWWNGIDLGVNGILGENHDFQLGDADFLEPKYGKSRYISFNFAQTKLKIVKNYVGLTTGMSFQIYNYKYGGGTEFSFSGDSLLAFPSGDKNITKNKIRVSYFAIPLMLEFNTSLDPDRAFHISAGVIGKVKIENMYKQKFSFEGDDNKTSIKGDLGFNTWQVDAMVRIGYRRLTLFTQVGMLPLFDNKNTPDVYTFASGFLIKI